MGISRDDRVMNDGMQWMGGRMRDTISVHEIN
jgi:hypothetical protein